MLHNDHFTQPQLQLLVDVTDKKDVIITVSLEQRIFNVFTLLVSLTYITKFFIFYC